MSSETTIRVNFGRPMPLFPLSTASLMPHGILPLHVFEPRYRQMVSDALDGPGQIAMAVFEGGPKGPWTKEYHGRPPIRPIVCVGQIIQHHALPEGRYNIALQGVCRAKILAETPAEEGRLYRTAYLEPVGVDSIDEDVLSGYREDLADMLEHEPLSALKDASAIAAHLREDRVPTSVLLEIIMLQFPVDSEARYSLLAAEDAADRAKIVRKELGSLGKMLKQAEPQRQVEMPKGCHWN